jgi:pyruvate,water dikinase
MVRNSEKLTALMNKFEGAIFFEELKNHEEGRAFLSEYDKFLELNFYRGHADRDMYFPRRIEDPGLDYIAIRLLATAENLEDPMERADKLNQRREAAIAEVIENLAKQPLGDLKVPIFKWLLNYSMRFFSGRDDSRPVSDIVTWQKKLPVRELGRRTVERGLLEGELDFYFLSLHELCDLLAGTLSKELARAKIAGRRKAFDRFVSHEEDPPTFLKGNVPMDSEQVTAGATGTVHKGIGTSPGTVTARAKIIPTQQDIGRLQKGDILVCHGTDPGWTSAFSIVSGVVAQTGGMLAHFSCLSREYGLPAVSLPHAMKLIKDGLRITVDGDKGEVRLMAK